MIQKELENFSSSCDPQENPMMWSEHVPCGIFQINCGHERGRKWGGGGRRARQKEMISATARILICHKGFNHV